MADWTLTATPVPADLDTPDAWAIHGVSAVSIATDRDRWGNDDLAYTPPEVLAHLRRQEYSTRLQLVATAPGAATEVIGTAEVGMPKRGNVNVAFVEVTVHPAHRRTGLGRALLAECERIATEHGRGTLIATTEHRGEPAPDEPDALVAPTGSGRISATARDARFALGAGYVLEQAERYSMLRLPVDVALRERLHRDAAERSGSEYRLISWAERTPDEWAEQYAELFTRMSTDAPSAGLEIEEDPWDSERLRASESDTTAAGHGYLTVVAEHVPTATLAAFTMVKYPLDRPEVVFQEDTLVLREHRGRRLGMLIKTDLLRRLAEVRPGVRRIHTWNAEENSAMLAINVALGFEPVGVCGMWQKKLGRPSSGHDGDRGGSGA